MTNLRTGDWLATDWVGLSTWCTMSPITHQLGWNRDQAAIFPKPNGTLHIARKSSTQQRYILTDQTYLTSYQRQRSDSDRRMDGRTDGWIDEGMGEGSDDSGETTTEKSIDWDPDRALRRGRGSRWFEVGGSGYKQVLSVSCISVYLWALVCLSVCLSICPWISWCSCNDL